MNKYLKEGTSTFSENLMKRGCINWMKKLWMKILMKTVRKKRTMMMMKTLVPTFKIN